MKTIHSEVLPLLAALKGITAKVDEYKDYDDFVDDPNTHKIWLEEVNGIIEDIEVIADLALDNYAST